MKTTAITLLVAALVGLAWLGREGDTRDARAGIGVVLVLAALVGVSVLFRRERHPGSSRSDAINSPEAPRSPSPPPPPEQGDPPPADGIVETPPAAPRLRDRSGAGSHKPRQQGKLSPAELTPEEVCTAVRRRMNAGELPKLEGDVWRVYDRVCQRAVPLEAVPEVVPGMTMAAAEAAWDRLRTWAEEETRLA